jgi:formate dehydrogenase subunit gamma
VPADARTTDAVHAGTAPAAHGPAVGAAEHGAAGNGTVGNDASRSHVVRHNRRTRWYHSAVYLVTFVLLVTGWWLNTGHEGRPSVLAKVADRPDTELHRQMGWLLAALLVVPFTIGVRATWTFVRDTLRADRGDLRWFLRWPIGALTGRFPSHRGRIDPGQRLANLAFVVTFAAVTFSGIGLTTVHGGPDFVWLVRLHRYGTYGLTPLVALHILLAIGVLPGYRGAWRSMHLGGRVPMRTVERLWPSSVPQDDRGREGEGSGE